MIECPADPHNYGSRNGDPIKLLVIHDMEGHPTGTAQVFKDIMKHTSAHYGIGLDGAIYRYVPDSFAAFHAGNSEVNRTSIGIELEGFMATLSVSEPQMAALVSLCDMLCVKYDIPRSRVFIIGHNEVPDPRHNGKYGGLSHHQDPGPRFPWDDFMHRLQAKSEPQAVA